MNLNLQSSTDALLVKRAMANGGFHKVELSVEEGVGVFLHIHLLNGHTVVLAANGCAGFPVELAVLGENPANHVATMHCGEGVAPEFFHG